MIRASELSEEWREGGKSWMCTWKWNMKVRIPWKICTGLNGFQPIRMGVPFVLCNSDLNLNRIYHIRSTVIYRAFLAVFPSFEFCLCLSVFFSYSVNSQSAFLICHKHNKTKLDSPMDASNLSTLSERSKHYCLIMPDQFYFLFNEHLGLKLKTGGENKSENLRLFPV